VPLYEKEGNRFFVLTEDFVGKDEEEARHIGLGSMLVECIFLDMKYTGAVMQLAEEVPHRKAKVGTTPVAIVSGPLFEEVGDEVERPEASPA